MTGHKSGVNCNGFFTETSKILEIIVVEKQRVTLYFIENLSQINTKLDFLTRLFYFLSGMLNKYIIKPTNTLYYK